MVGKEAFDWDKIDTNGYGNNLLQFLDQWVSWEHQPVSLKGESCFQNLMIWEPSLSFLTFDFFPPCFRMVKT